MFYYVFFGEVLDQILRGVQDWLTPRIHTFKPEEISALLEVQFGELELPSFDRQILEKFGPDNAPLATLTPRRERALIPTGLTDTPPMVAETSVNDRLRGSLLVRRSVKVGSGRIECSQFDDENDAVAPHGKEAPGYTPRMHLTPGRGYPIW